LLTQSDKEYLHSSGTRPHARHRSRPLKMTRAACRQVPRTHQNVVYHRLKYVGRQQQVADRRRRRRPLAFELSLSNDLLENQIVSTRQLGAWKAPAAFGPEARHSVVDDGRTEPKELTMHPERCYSRLANDHGVPMRRHRFEMFLWGMTCLGIWLWLARDLWSAALCAVVTVAPTIFFARLLHQEKSDHRSN